MSPGITAEALFFELNLFFAVRTVFGFAVGGLGSLFFCLIFRFYLCFGRGFAVIVRFSAVVFFAVKRFEVFAVHDAVEFFRRKFFSLDQIVRDFDQFILVLRQDFLRAGVCLVDDAFDLRVYLRFRLVGAVALCRQISAEEHLIVIVAERDRAELGHSVFRNHVSGERRRSFDVVGRSRAHIVENDLLRNSAAQKPDDAVKDLLFRHVLFVFRRDVIGISRRHASRDDRDLVNGVLVFEEARNDRVTAS